MPPRRRCTPRFAVCNATPSATAITRLIGVGLSAADILSHGGGNTGGSKEQYCFQGAGKFYASRGACFGTPIRDTGCCCHPLTCVPYLRPGPRRDGCIQHQLSAGEHPSKTPLTDSGRPLPTRAALLRRQSWSLAFFFVFFSSLLVLSLAIVLIHGSLCSFQPWASSSNA